MKKTEALYRLKTAIAYGRIYNRSEAIKELTSMETEEDIVRVIKLGRNKYYIYYTC